MASPNVRIKNYTFDPRLGTTGRWRLNGRIVKEAAVTADLERVVTGYKSQMQNLSQQLIDKTISLADWQTGMANNLREAHNIQGAIAKGGWKNMTPSDWGNQGVFIKRQRAFLQQFAIEVETGKQKLNGNFMRRAGMYADASRGTHHDVRRRVASDNGFTEEKRKLNPADHCTDCVDFAGLPWSPIKTLPRIGDSICRTNCKCEFLFR